MKAEEVKDRLKMTDTDILKIDFYDICGIASIFMSDQDKINYWKEFTNQKHKPTKQ